MGAEKTMMDGGQATELADGQGSSPTDRKVTK